MTLARFAGTKGFQKRDKIQGLFFCLGPHCPKRTESPPHDKQRCLRTNPPLSATSCTGNRVAAAFTICCSCLVLVPAPPKLSFVLCAVCRRWLVRCLLPKCCRSQWKAVTENVGLVFDTESNICLGSVFCGQATQHFTSCSLASIICEGTCTLLPWVGMASARPKFCFHSTDNRVYSRAGLTWRLAPFHEKLGNPKLERCKDGFGVG